MRIFISLLFITFSFSWASVFDFKHLYDAKKAYKNKDYEKAADSYSKVDNDEAKFNQADSFLVFYKRRGGKKMIRMVCWLEGNLILKH